MSGAQRILVIEDHPKNRQLVQFVLHSAGYTVELAEDGESGIVMAGAFQPDLILMDLGLPGIDGRETTRRLKADPATASIPVLAVTGFVTSGEREQAMQAGCDGYLAKPYRRAALLEAVAACTGEALEDNRGEARARA